MPQKILIALDGSEISSKIVEFAAKTLSNNSLITLFSVVPIVDLLCELDPPFIKGFAPEHYQDYCQKIQTEKNGFWKKRCRPENKDF